MKALALLLFAVLGSALAGCVVVPVVETPGVYVVAPPPPAYVVRPQVRFRYDSYGGRRNHRW